MSGTGDDDGPGAAHEQELLIAIKRVAEDGLELKCHVVDNEAVEGREQITSEPISFYGPGGNAPLGDVEPVRPEVMRALLDEGYLSPRSGGEAESATYKFVSFDVTEKGLARLRENMARIKGST